jgi:hypothetical protein
MRRAQGASMQYFKDGGFTLMVRENEFVFQGKIEKSDYTELGKFLSDAEKEINGDELKFDFRLLELLNSAGVRAFAIFFLECRKKLTISINPEITWQKVGLIPLKTLRKGFEVITG